MAKLHLENVSYAYGPKSVLKRINLSLESNRFYGIIGPNGAGKSTLLKLLDSFIKPKAGIIYLNQKPLTSYSLKELAKEISLVPQNSPDLPYQVEEVVLLGRTPYGSRWQKPSAEDLKIVEESLKLCEIEHLKGRYFNTLSGGERQRVTLARVFAQKTAILLLDEPTTHLDLEHQIKICQLLKQKSNKGLMCIAVLHDLNLAANYCDEVIVIQKGELIKTGAPDEVFTSELIEQIYKIPVNTVNHPKTGRPIIVP